MHVGLVYACTIVCVQMRDLRDHAKAISLLSDCLKKLRDQYGQQSPSTIMAATWLGSAYTEIRETQKAITVLDGAWVAAKGNLTPDNVVHTRLFRCYVEALVQAHGFAYNDAPNKEENIKRVQKQFLDIVKDAESRGLPALQIVQTGGRRKVMQVDTLFSDAQREMGSQ